MYMTQQMKIYTFIDSELKELESHWKAIVAAEAARPRRRPRLYSDCMDLLRSIRQLRHKLERKHFPNARSHRRPEKAS